MSATEASSGPPGLLWTGKVQLLGYSEGGDAITARITGKGPSISFSQRKEFYRDAYRLEFFPPASPLPVTLNPTSPISFSSLNPNARSFLTKIQGDTDQNKKWALDLSVPKRDRLTWVQFQATEEIASRYINTRTSDVYRAPLTPSLAPFPIVVKIFSARYLPSIAKEALFYENVLPQLKLSKTRLPRFVGVYGDRYGGWYAIVMEDLGSRLGDASEWGRPLTGEAAEEQSKREKLEKRARQMDRELALCGIRHNDICPRNVLLGREEDGPYVIDFGDSYLMEETELEKLRETAKGKGRKKENEVREQEQEKTA